MALLPPDSEKNFLVRYRPPAEGTQSSLVVIRYANLAQKRYKLVNCAGVVTC